MKCLLVLVLVGVVSAQFSGFNPSFQRSAPYQPSGWRPSRAFNLPLRQELPQYRTPKQSYGVPSNEYGAPSSKLTSEVQDFARNAPNQPSSWNSNRAFNLPLQQQLPRYSAPEQSYGPPPSPEPTTEVPEITTTDAPTTTTEQIEAEEIKDNEKEKSGKLSEESTAVKEEGVYYIYHPTGLLQRIMYSTNDDVKNMAYTTQLKYQNVDPIREPIYTYDPQTFAFKRL